jgi:hypothetical protein
MNLALAMTAGAAMCGLVSAQTPAQQRMAIMISLNGFPAYALDDAKLPVPTLRRPGRADFQRGRGAHHREATGGSAAIGQRQTTAAPVIVWE